MKKKKSNLSFVEIAVGFSSFIPFAGSFLSLVSIVLGAVKFKLGGGKLIWLGIFGFLVNASFYFFLLHISFQGVLKVMDVNQEMSQQKLRLTVLAVEFYKQVHGKYPDTLEAVVPDSNWRRGNTFLYDDSISNQKALQYHQYHLAADGKTYNLFDVGLDAVPGTADDLYPPLSPEEIAHSGYRKLAVAVSVK